MSEDFPITELAAPEDFFFSEEKSAAARLFEAVTSGQVQTHEGGFFIHLECEKYHDHIDYKKELNQMFDDHAEIWRLESETIEGRHPVDGGINARVVMLFRTLDMHEALSF